jgi:uncharacterized membrane protein YidH (DUF202 family)
MDISKLLEKKTKILEVANTNNKDQITLAKMNTLLSNQRTYFSYVRTGLSIIAFAIAAHNYFLLLCGGIILIKGVYQYYKINANLLNDDIRISSFVNLYDVSAIIVFGCIFAWFYYKDGFITIKR